MTTLLSQSNPRAIKDHDCSSCERLTQDDWWRCGGGLSFSEIRSIAIAKANGWKIKKGENYIRQSLVSYGEFYEFKAIPAIHDICIKHDLYQK